MNPIDLSYIARVSNRLPLYKVKKNTPFEANFRCVLCGDSEKNKHKTRGWFLERDNKAFYYCHNCNASMQLQTFLKTFDVGMYNDYCVDSLLEKTRSREIVKGIVPSKPIGLDTLLGSRPVFQRLGSPLLDIKKVSSLKPTSPVKKYVNKRHIPPNQHYRLYHASKFNAWVNTQIPGKLSEKYDEPRLVLPFIYNGRMFGFTGRSYKPNAELRYITIMVDTSMPKIFGLDKVNFLKPYTVVEGGLDSLFLDNSVAMAGADGNMNGLGHTENATLCFDNEPRNKEIVNRIEKAIDQNLSVCIWPDHLTQNDINDMVLAGLNPNEIIRENTYKGLSAKLRLSDWRKV